MRNWILSAAIVWTLFIIYACLTKAADIPQAFWLDIPNKDKIVHFAFYFVFTLLWVRVIGQNRRFTSKQIRLYIFLSAVVFGILIEVCQGLFTTERSPDVLDALANTSGSALSVFVLWLLEKRSNKINIPSR